MRSADTPSLGAANDCGGENGWFGSYRDEPSLTGDAMTLIEVTLRALPTRLLVWLERRRAPLGERTADIARREGTRRPRSGRRVHDHFIPF
jgi:hypothetical protein